MRIRLFWRREGLFVRRRRTDIAIKGFAFFDHAHFDPCAFLNGLQGLFQIAYLSLQGLIAFGQAIDFIELHFFGLRKLQNFGPTARADPQTILEQAEYGNEN